MLAVSILPIALKEKKSSLILDFEKRYEKLGFLALASQIVSGLWLAWYLLGTPSHWFVSSPVTHALWVKFTLLALTGGLAVNARTRVIPHLNDNNISKLAVRIRLVTLTAVLFVLAGVTIRFRGYPVFAQ